MENTKLVVDTSIWIEFLRAKDKRETTLFRLDSSLRLYISSVTLYELLMGATTETKKKDVYLLTNDLVVLPFDEQVSTCAADIYHELKEKNQLIEFRDIFIAATCLANEIPLITLNRKHFARIKTLTIY
jgi:tRNA(fMet)-specific endonuclease VapC